MKKPAATLVFCTGLLCSCATTQLVVPNNPDADIFVNNNFKGKGSAMINRRGIPASSYIVAKYRGKEIGSIKIKRKFDYQTCAAGCFSYGIGSLLYWGYPETVIIPCIYVDRNPQYSAWDNPISEKWNPVNK